MGSLFLTCNSIKCKLQEKEKKTFMEVTQDLWRGQEKHLQQQHNRRIYGKRTRETFMAKVQKKHS